MKDEGEISRLGVPLPPLGKWAIRRIFLWGCLLLPWTACTAEKPEKANPSEPAALSREILNPAGCQDCHNVTVDSNHDFPCLNCHGGDQTSGEKTVAHAGLITAPARPERMSEFCAPCHAQQVEEVSKSVHFTLSDEVNLVRSSFGAAGHISDPRRIPQSETIETVQQLADDMLRRRCLRCHPYSPGDSSRGSTHGLGCGACHLAFDDGKLSSHRFIKSPGDEVCLSCHHGNYVGYDYYGRFETDYHWDYRTPFLSEDGLPPMYGIEYHQLQPDLHQLAGLNCIDCHPGQELMSQTPVTITCRTCHLHGSNSGEDEKNHGLTLQGRGRQTTLITKLSGKRLQVPQLRNKAHQDIERLGCGVCHAQWSFTDQGVHLLRQDGDEFDQWQPLTVQSSSQVQEILEASIHGEEFIDPVMDDPFSDEAVAGTWLKGFELRRWETPQLCKDEADVLQVCRPILDLHLSYMDDEGEVRFDSVASQAPNNGLRPYTPHTMGKAGPFRRSSHLVPRPNNPSSLTEE